MSIIPIPFNKESLYVKAVITKLKKENLFHIEKNEEVIDIYDFFDELLNLIEKERESRQGVNSENN